MFASLPEALETSPVKWEVMGSRDHALFIVPQVGYGRVALPMRIGAAGHTRVLTEMGADVRGKAIAMHTVSIEFKANFYRKDKLEYFE